MRCTRALRASYGAKMLFAALIVSRPNIGKRVVKCLSEQGKFPSQRGCAHQPVVGIDRNAEADADPSRWIGCWLMDGTAPVCTLDVGHISNGIC